MKRKMKRLQDLVAADFPDYDAKSSKPGREQNFLSRDTAGRTFSKLALQ
jgi:hypothetical protein